MVYVEIIDLPKGFGDYKYVPPKATYMYCKHVDRPEPSFELYHLQNPLVLRIGDVVGFTLSQDVPRQIRELTFDNSSHPAYARFITEVEFDAKQKLGEASADKSIRFVGSGSG
jgi:hypothetical protein